jgi:hypothetical protein
MLALLIAAALIAHSGEWVTRASDGTRICQLSRDLFASEVVRAGGWCSNWTIAPPLEGERIEPNNGWVRPRGPGGLELHFENGWR